MQVDSSIPPPFPQPRPYSIAAHRRFNDEAEAAQRRDTVRRMRRARRSGSRDERIEALEATVDALVASRSAR